MKGSNSEFIKSQIRQIEKETPRKTLKSIQKLTHKIQVPEPQALFHTFILKKYGDYYENGEVISELMLSNISPKWRVDFALPNWKVAIEMDGWQYHGKYLKDFKRDRKKDKFLASKGWLTLRFTNSELRSDPLECINLIESCLEHRVKKRVIVEPYGLSYNILKGQSM
ncbi:MAG: DUF559 domain-containing protein [Endozoicomonadaceae bacterium]|nr:DUF559 domain-containing protein [Endozoicomonadaceae bacterium]